MIGLVLPVAFFAVLVVSWAVIDGVDRWRYRRGVSRSGGGRGDKETAA